MEISFPPNSKRYDNVMNNLKEEVALRKQNGEQNKDSEGLFGLLKNNSLENENENETGNWFDRTEFNCGAIQFPEATDELFSGTKKTDI